MIKQSQEEFFQTYNVEPCRHCMKRKMPGSGIGPIIGSILFDVYADSEIERLERKALPENSNDNYDLILQERNRALYVRACWLSNVVPDDHARNPIVASQSASKAA